jgi:hypothetical protein
MNYYLSKRRINSWLRSPGFYLQKAKHRVVGIDSSFFANSRDTYTPGSEEWLALTEIAYGGLQLGGVATKVNKGGDRMSPHHHGYGSAYECFLRPHLGKRMTLLEIGVLNGTGLAIWCDLFPSSKVVGMDIDLSNCLANMPRLQQLGAFKYNRPELYYLDQLDRAQADQVLAEVFGSDRLSVVIDDGCHSIESIEITFAALKPYLAEEFVYFIEDNFDTYDRLAPRYPEFRWTSRGEITIVRNR